MKRFGSVVRLGVACLAALSLVRVQAATDATYKWIDFSTSATEILPGEWNRNFKEVKAAAIEANAPMFIFWGNNGCGYCELLEKAMAKQAFVDYMQESGLYYCFAVAGDAKAGKQAGSAKSAAKDGSGKFPYIGFFFQKEGEAKPVTHKGHGRSGEMAGEVKKGAIEEQLISTIKKWVGDWTPIKGGQFFVKSAGQVESEGNRYETEAGVETVTVKLTRTASAAKKAYDEKLVIAGEGSVTTQKLSWAENDAEKEIDIDVSSLAKDGDKLQLTLVDENGKAGKDGQTATITFVEKENGAANPLWTTERTDPYANGAAPELKFGEWTMDLDAATHLADRDGGYVLVSVQGSLWCPDCANTDRNFLDVEKDGANRFRAWAAEKKVALVSLDVPKFNSHGGADGPLVSFEETTAKAPTLLSREGMETTLVHPGEYPASGASEELTKPLYRSGLGYLSRKGISDAEAEATLKRNWELITKDVSVGGFHEKTDGWLNRTGVPIFVLLNGKGEPVARFTQFASVSPMAADQAKWDAYIQRFNEMLAIADDKAAAGVEATELGNNALVAASATELGANGGQAQGRVSAVDQQDAFYLKGMTGNARLAVTVTGDDRARVTVYLATDDDYKATPTSTGATTKKYVLDSKAFASGALDASGVRVTRAFDKPGDCFVVVKAESGVAVDSAEATFHAFTVKCEIDALLPSEAAAVANAPAGSDKIGIELENGCVYRLTGLADAGNADLVKKEGAEDIYTYNGATGKCQLTLATAGGEITFQKWNPGRVGFDPDYVTLPAKKSTKKDVTVTRKENVGIDIAYRRTEGYSGDVKVRVRFDKEASTFFYDYAIDPSAGAKEIPRFYVDGKLDFLENPVVAEAEWKDGAALDDCRGIVSVTIRETEVQKIQSFFGDGCVVFNFEVVEETEAGEHVIDNGTFTVNFTENQKPKPGKVAFTDTVPYFAKSQTVYARASSGVEVTVSRVENDENPIYTTIKRSVPTTTVKAADELTDEWFEPATQLLGWDNHDRRDRALVVTNLPPAGKSVKLSFSPATSGLKADSSRKTVTIVSVADDAPAFANEREYFTLYRYVACSNEVAVTGLTEGALAFTKLSGSIPKGVSVKYNPVTRSMLVTGVPTADTGKKSGGLKTYVAYYQVTEKRPTEKKNKTNNVAGLVVRLELTVVDPVVAGTGDPVSGAALNAACATTRKLNSIPFIDTDDFEQGKRLLAGVMNNLTLPVKGNASAKFVSEDGTFSFSAKNWSEIDPDDGTLSVRLACTTKGFKGYYADVSVSSNGTVEVSVNDGSNEYAQTVPGDAQWSVKNPATDYAGYYTVSLCEPKTVGDEKFDGYAPTGSGYLTFSMATVKKVTSSSAVATGTMKWAGVLPNGKAVSGSSVLLDHGESAWLPYFTGTSGKAGEVFFGVADIARGAAENIKAEEPCYKAVTVAVETDPEDEEHVWEIPTFWRHTQVKDILDLDYSVTFDVRGSYYDQNLTVLPLDCCCEAFHGSTNMFICLTMPGASETYGELGPVSPVELTVGSTSIAVKKGAANPQSLKLSFSKKTGVVSGSFKLPVENGKAQSASYKGVVVVGWGNGGSCSECGEGKFLPFVNGCWWFTDKASYEKESRGKVTQKTSKVNRGGTAFIEAAHAE